MKKTLKAIVSVILSVIISVSVLAFPAAAAAGGKSSLPMLHTEGDKILDKNGNEVVLRGTNFGGWGIMEDWFCPYTSPSGLEPVYQKLVSRFGLEKTHKLFRTYRENWITETDFRNVADLGMNVIRLPLWYRDFQSDEKGTWYRNGKGGIDWSELDRMIELCGRYGLYLILDLHGVPGYQNDYDHCGQSKSMTFFDSTEEAAGYRKTVLNFWRELAAHCKGNSTVVMYDLVNEPLGVTGRVITDEMRQTFYDYMDELYREIRKIDPDHIITMEAVWDASKLPAPEEYGWENVVYQIHLYDISNVGMLYNVIKDLKSGYDCPFYVGEFYPRGIASFDYMLSLFNREGLSWTTWTYKGAGPDAANSPWFLYGNSDYEKIDQENDSYDELMRKWGSVLRTEKSFSRTAFADIVKYYTDGTIDEVALVTFGISGSVGTAAERQALHDDKIGAIITTIKDWLRKLKTGDLI